MRLYVLALEPKTLEGFLSIGMEDVILRVVRSIKAVLILLHVLVNILHLDMRAETIGIREQQLSLVAILRLGPMRKLYSILPLVLFNKRYQDSDSLFSLYQFNDITVANFNFHFCTNAKRRYIP